MIAFEASTKTTQETSISMNWRQLWLRLDTGCQTPSTPLSSRSLTGREKDRFTSMLLFISVWPFKRLQVHFVKETLTWMVSLPLDTKTSWLLSSMYVCSWLMSAQSEASSNYLSSPPCSIGSFYIFTNCVFSSIVSRILVWFFCCSSLSFRIPFFLILLSDFIEFVPPSHCAPNSHSLSMEIKGWCCDW